MVFDNRSTTIATFSARTSIMNIPIETININKTTTQETETALPTASTKIKNIEAIFTLIVIVLLLVGILALIMYIFDLEFTTPVQFFRERK